LIIGLHLNACIKDCNHSPTLVCTFYDVAQSGNDPEVYLTNFGDMPKMKVKNLERSFKL
jgi:hypothetical protein